ncbi:hypothetical protein BO99DRAFT_117410 [Aspergillus violaceofuscus CBS 115571]|uniref:Secreted protein n=1 Tax=Aspergillus violaceofuscus (strain CBS 115571) TaxID=1450538 RepID=A0A2V5HFJ4_ASPV1|nr:hypothetical protein BO99DRAFT_117410 [Aspergillus violaceofuscus CBS 115571]
MAASRHLILFLVETIAVISTRAIWPSHCKSSTFPPASLWLGHQSRILERMISSYSFAILTAFHCPLRRMRIVTPLHF